MSYEFKSINDIEVVAEPTESANVLIEENGVIKKAPKTAVDGAGGANVIMYTCNSGRLHLDGVDVGFDSLVEAYESGAILRVKFEGYTQPTYGTIVGFTVHETSDGDVRMAHYVGGQAGDYVEDFQWGD